MKFTSTSVIAAAALATSVAAVDPALIPSLGFQSGVNPTGTGDCDGTIPGVKIPCSCPPSQQVYVDALNANVAAGHAIHNPSIAVSFPTGNSVGDRATRITAALITLQNLNGPGVGCPASSTTLVQQQKALQRRTLGKSRALEERGGKGKRGLCWPFYNAPLDPAKLNDGKGSVNMIYDYETNPPISSNGAGGLAFIGMQRCLDCASSPIAQLATRQKAQGWATVFTLNEPDVNGITPPQAAAWYKQNINPLPIKKALPAITSSTNPGQGLDWLQQMVAACNGGCFFDYINLHHYGPDFASFKNHVLDANKRFPGKQIVITEFALQNPKGGQADQVAFYKQAFEFLDASPFVEMYFPFVATSPSLFAQNDANGVKFVGTGSTLYNDDKSISAVGKLMLA